MLIISSGDISNTVPNEPAHDKPYNKTCATSKDSDQPAHLCSLIRVFADNMCLLQPQGYSKKDKRESLPYWVDVQADLSLCWLHRSYCRFCHVLAQMLLSGKNEKNIRFVIS